MKWSSAGLLCACFCSSLLILTGCGPESRLSIGGTVKVGGKPIEKGGIEFVPLDPNSKGFRVGSELTNGAYSLDATRGPYPGNYRVEIFWLKPTGKKVSSGGEAMVDEYDNVLPPKYNSKSELTAEITSSTDRLDFDLTP
jgi:hypothetical protein